MLSLFSLRFVWDKLKGVRGKFLLGLGLSVFYCAFGLVAPYLSKQLVDDGIKGGQTSVVLPLVLGMIGAVALTQASHLLRVLLLEQASQTMLINVRRFLFDNIQHQEMSFFDRMRTGDIITRATGDLNYLRHFVAYVSYCCCDFVFISVFSVILLFRENRQLSVALLCILPLILTTSLIYSKKVGPLYRANRERLSKLNEGASENIDGNRAVKAFAREDYEIAKFDAMSRDFKKGQMAAAVANLKLSPFMALFSQSITVIAMLLGGLLAIRGVDAGGITVGQITLFVSVGGPFAGAVSFLPSLINSLHQFKASAHKVVELCEASPLITDRVDAVALPEGQRLTGHVEFRDVSFAYPRGRRVLDHVSFEILPGQTVAIMGPTGSGKTTLVDLLARFYDVTDGAVLLDGVDVRFRRLSDIHSSVAVATQDVFLFSDTVDSNIAFSDVEMSEEDVCEFARLSAADGFIRELSEGYGTIVGERGVGLSGGQRQRIALARALAAKPSLLILDDTTSAVDMETEKIIQSSLRHLPFDCTKIIIAQRISSVRHADVIFILQNGHVDAGTHESLCRTNAYYREVCELQDVGGLPPFAGQVETQNDPEAAKPTPTDAPEGTAPGAATPAGQAGCVRGGEGA